MKALRVLRAGLWTLRDPVRERITAGRSGRYQLGLERMVGGAKKYAGPRLAPMASLRTIKYFKIKITIGFKTWNNY